MLKELVSFRPVTSLIPNTGIQFLDFGFNADALGRLSRRFWPEVLGGQVDDMGCVEVNLHLLSETEDGEPVRADNRARVPVDDVLSVRSGQALDLLCDQWLPVPFLREKQPDADLRIEYDVGPTNWARVRVTALDAPDVQGHTHRVTLAFDTLVLARRAEAPYAAPEPYDSTEDVQFSLVDDPTLCNGFLNLKWVKEWLRDAYLEGLSRRRGRPVSAADMESPGAFWGYYILLLDAVAQGCSIPRLRLVDTLTEAIQTPPVDVDLVIDVGNSRTCGILIEQPKDQGPVDITQAYRLELRDLSRPHQTYADPFESRVEFAPAQFGRADHSRNSGRPQRDAFWWPSPVRVGPEAAWLASLADGTEGVSGLSSPKRYLWDTAPRVQPWTNSRGLLPVTRPVPAISGPMTALLTEEGDPVDPTRPDSFVGMLPRYSRSSLYSLMLGELLIHAVNQINSIAVRERRPNSDLPRRLRQIILTLPSATPLAEQKILRRRAAAAVDLVWKTMGWDAAHKPRLKLDWDEATCTHLVYLYNEINHKYRGNPRDLFERIGRTAPSGAPAVRIASLDLGGGTSDLMIIQHEIDAGGQFTVHPRPLFREGFRQAGDDIVKVVVEDCVLPALAEAMQAAGVAQPTALLADLLGGDHERMGQQERAMRSLLNQQLFVPAAYALLLAYEQTDPRHPQAPRTLVYGDILRTAPPSPAVTGFLESRIQRAGGNGFVLADVLLRMDEGQMAGAVLSVIRGMVEDLCDVIRQYDCDLLLLTGRPSRLPALRELVCANLPVTPDRILSMHDYEVGRWYPFRTSDFRISDPKTTAAVGAMLCQVCEGVVRGFVMRASEIRMKSTARYIGIMDINDQILERNCLLQNVDLDTGAGIVAFELRMEAPLAIGFRQLPIERWKTTPLYALEFRHPERVPTLKMPLKVRFERADPRTETDEGALEDFRIVEVTDREGASARQNVTLRLQTMPVQQQAEGGYWLDTGILRTRGRY